MCDAHVFGLAQALRRPIIVYDRTLDSPSGCVYLPVFYRPEDCIRSPIAVAWSSAARDHFVALCPIALTDPCALDGLKVTVRGVPASLSLSTSDNALHTRVAPDVDSVNVTVTPSQRRISCILTPACLPHTLSDGASEAHWEDVHVWGMDTPEAKAQALRDYLGTELGPVELGRGEEYNLGPIISLMRKKFVEDNNVDLPAAEHAFEGDRRFYESDSRHVPVSTMLDDIAFSSIDSKLVYCSHCCTTYTLRASGPSGKTFFPVLPSTPSFGPFRHPCISRQRHARSASPACCGTTVSNTGVSFSSLGIGSSLFLAFDKISFRISWSHLLLREVLTAGVERGHVTVLAAAP
jgi:hypothetical protein